VPFWAYLGPLALHLRLLAIIIIPNSAGLFNINLTFLKKCFFNYRFHRLYDFWSVGRLVSIEKAVLAEKLTRIGKNSIKYLKSAWLEVTIDLMLMEAFSCIFLII
jgi:hypothetical protein